MSEINKQIKPCYCIEIMIANANESSFHQTWQNQEESHVREVGC